MGIRRWQANMNAMKINMEMPEEIPKAGAKKIKRMGNTHPIIIQRVCLSNFIV
jgi:hypothetical protein